MFSGRNIYQKRTFQPILSYKKNSFFTELWATLYMYYFTKIIIIHIFMTKTHDSWLPYSCPSSIYLLMAPLNHAPPLSTCSWLSYLLVLIAPPCSACSIYLLMAPPCSACSISSCERSLTNHSKLFWSRLIQKKCT